MKKKELTDVEKLQLKLNNIKQNAKYEFTWTYEDLQGMENLLQKVERLETELSDKEYIELIYKNLRKNWNKLVDEILGKDYYNMGMDTYTCDDLTCEDIIYNYHKSLRLSKKVFKRR